MRYFALIEKDAASGAWGAWFPEFPGCVAQAETMDEAIAFAADALAEWLGDVYPGGAPDPGDVAALSAREDVRADIGRGASLVAIPYVKDRGRPAKANLSLDAGLLEAIDDAARRRGVTRSAWIGMAAREALKSGA